MNTKLEAKKPPNPVEDRGKKSELDDRDKTSQPEEKQKRKTGGDNGH